MVGNYERYLLDQSIFECKLIITRLSHFSDDSVNADADTVSTIKDISNRLTTIRNQLLELP